MPCDGSSVLCFQEKFLNLGIGMVIYLTLTIAAAVERAVVHDDENTILGTLKVEFYHIDSHVNRVLKCLE